MESNFRKTKKFLKKFPISFLAKKNLVSIKHIVKNFSHTKFSKNIFQKCLKIIGISTEFLKLNGLKNLTPVCTKIGTNLGKAEKKKLEEARRMLRVKHYFNCMTKFLIVNSFFVDYYFGINKISQRRVRK